MKKMIYIKPESCIEVLMQMEAMLAGSGAGDHTGNKLTAVDNEYDFVLPDEDESTGSLNRGLWDADEANNPTVGTPIPEFWN